MAKKIINKKEPVRLRTKQLADGSLSLYFDIYRNGKRSYEYLKMYLIPEKSEQDKEQNRVTLDAANKLKSERIIELTKGEAGIKTDTKVDKVNLIEWVEKCKLKYEKMGKKCSWHFKSVINTLRILGAENMTVDEVDKRFCERYMDYLRTEYKNKSGLQIAPDTQRHFYVLLNSSLNAAVREELIDGNPFKKLDSSYKIHIPQSKRDYMTVEEVRTLIATPWKKRPDIKNAYLFSCFCGLRISDLYRLTWKDIYQDGEQTRIELVMQKTKEPIYLPLSQEALRWMPEQGNKQDTDLVFDLPANCVVNYNLRHWAKEAGITKKISFHTSRHTFATMMLTLGADLYTTSKLLGHTDIHTTQIYAKIVNQKKDEAVNLVNGLFD